MDSIAVVIVVAGWFALWIVGSIIYRKKKGKPIFRPRFNHVLFLEVWRSGRSFRNVLSRFGGARSCLWIAVDDKRLHIGPHFPFSLMFLPEVYSPECEVSGSAIESAGLRPTVFGKKVWIRLDRNAGRREEIEVWVKDPDTLLNAIALLKQ